MENVFCGGRELAVLHVFRDGQKEVKVARRILLALCLNTNCCLITFQVRIQVINDKLGELNELGESILVS